MIETMKRSPCLLSALSVTADVLIALAVVALLVPSTAILPLVPLVVLAPVWLGRILSAIRIHPDMQFVPDPHKPGWQALALAMLTAMERVERERHAVTLRLASLCHPDGSARPYEMDVIPGRNVLAVREPGESRRQEYRLATVPRFHLPLPVVVGPDAVVLRFEPSSAADGPGKPRLYQEQCSLWDPHLPVALILPAMIAVFHARMGLLLAVAALVPLLSRAITGTLDREAMAWRLVRRPNARPGVGARADALRLWMAVLILARQVAPGLGAGRALQDPLALLFWGLLVPSLAFAGWTRSGGRRQSRRASPS